MIPSELLGLRQWVVWRVETREGKPTKVPYRVDGKGRASATEPGSWGTFQEARAAEEGFVGLGFVFTEGDPFCGLDLDACRDPESGELDATAAALLRRFDSYAEVSPSGTGLHILVRAAIPGNRRRRGRLELYDSARFFCITGDHLEGTPTTIEPRQDVLDWLYALTFPPAPSLSSSAAPPLDLADRDLLELARQARNGAAFERLWAGDTAGYDSHSEADLALAGALAFWTGPDPARIDALFRQSGLMREKWERADYRERTIAAALDGRTEFYSGGQPESPYTALEPEPVEAEAEPFRITVYTARELCALPMPETSSDLVGPFLRRARITLLGGTTGHGKTTFGALMLATGVLGGEFLGWEVEGGLRVLVLDLEQHLEDIQDQLVAVGLDQSEQVDYAPLPEGLQIDRDPEQLAELERIVAAKPYDIVRADPFYKLHAADSSDELQARALVRLTRRWVNQHGFALLMDTHTRKRIDPRSGFLLDDLFGSSLFARDPEVVLGLQLLDDGFSRLHVFKARGRRGDIRTGQKIDLLYDDEELFRRKPEEPDRDIRAELIELGSDHAWRTLKEWKAKPEAGGIGASQDKVRATLGELQAEGIFEYAEGPPGRSPKALCWRLRPTDPSPEVSAGQSGQSRSPRDAGGVTDLLTPTPVGGQQSGQFTRPSPAPSDPEAQVSPADEGRRFCAECEWPEECAERASCALIEKAAETVAGKEEQ